MRLKMKMILICCTSVLFSSIICSVAVYSLVKNISLDAAEGQSFKNVLTGFTELENRIRELYVDKMDEVDREVLGYILKEQDDEMLLCFSGTGDREEDIYNCTILEQEGLEALSYDPVEDSGVDMARMQWEDRHFFVYRQEGCYGGFVMYKLEDVTYVWERMRFLGGGLMILTCVITMLVCLILFIIIGRVLRPLHKLNTGAEQIARGCYDERIEVARKDEIGELSDNFNRMAEAVQCRTERLEEAEWKRTLFMGNLTHELKTPMTAISGYAKTLLTVKLSERDKEEALSYIYEESCRLERLSQKMMELLLLEENGQIRMEEVSADVLFRKAAEACSHSLAEDGIHLECRGRGEKFLADADLFAEVLINLIDNARRASQRGDTIILSASRNIIEVRDFGTGIPEGEMEKIMEPFYMIDKSRSRKSGGAGLGLAITALILKQHNCEITIESTVGQGTRMILQFV